MIPIIPLLFRRRSAFLSFTIMIFFSSWAQATPRFWIGSGTNWNNTASWSASSGGGTCTCTPGAGDIAIFDGKGLGNATLNVNVVITSITVSTTTGTGAYTGTITMLSTATLTLSQNLLINHGTFNVQSSTGVTVLGDVTINGGSFANTASSVTVGGSWTAAAGAFTAGTSTVTFNSTATGKTITTGNNLFNTVIFNGTGGYWTMQDSMTVISSMTLTAGTLDTNSGSNLGISVGKSWFNNGGIFVSNLSTVTFTGSLSTLQIKPNPSSFENVVFNGAGTWTLQSSMTLTGSLTLTAGTLNTSAGNLGISVDNEWLNTGGTFIANSSTITWTGAGSNLRIRPNTSNFFRMYFIGSGSWQTDTNPVTISSHVIINAGTLSVLSGSTMTINGNVTIANGASLAISTDTKVTGSLLNSGTVSTSASGALFTASGTFTLGGTGNTTLPKLTLVGVSQATTLGGPITVQGQLSNSATHTLDVSGSNYSITASSDWLNSGTFTCQTGSVTFTSAGTNTQIASNGFNFYAMRFNGTGSWLEVTKPVTVLNNMVIDGGTFNINGSSLTIASDINVNTGGTLSISSNVAVSGGDITNAGTITSLSTATVALSGTGTLGGAGASTFPRLTMSGATTTTLGGNITVQSSMTIGSGHTLDANSVGNYQITISSYWANQGTFNAQNGTVVINSTAGLFGQTTFYNLTAATPGITLTFTAGSTQAVTGTLLMSGASGNPVKLRSSSAAQSFFKVIVSSWVSNVDVQFSKATGNTLYAGRASTNTGNNTNWVFDYYPGDITDFSAAPQLNGTVNLTWSAPLDPDDNPLGVGSQYAIQWATYTVVWSTSNVGETLSTGTWHMYVATSNVSPGSGQVFVSTSLAGGMTYFFKIWTQDPAGQWSAGLSNTASGSVTTVLSVTFSSSSYNFGNVFMAATTVSTSTMHVTNAGNVTETYSLSVATTGVNTIWAVGTTPPTTSDKFLLYGAFNATQPLQSSFGTEDIVISTAAASSATVFSVGGQTGVSTPSGSTRNIWLRLDMPPSTTTTQQQQMSLTVTASTP